MIDLKTLKDITLTRRADGTKCEAYIPDASILKQEAIKWIKDYQIDFDLWHEESKTIHYIQGQMDSLISFFNISEEDLK